MDLTGLGVLLIGIAFLVLAIFFSRVLNNFSKVIDGVEKTVEQLPGQLDTILQETGNLIHHSNDTLADVNEKLGTLTPFFQIVGDVGQSTRTLSSSLVDVTASVQKKMAKAGDEPTQDKKLGGAYGSAALGYYLLQKRKELKRKSPKKTQGKFYKAGEIRALEIEHIKKSASALVDPQEK